ncbi:hypothetical protein OAI86_04150 [Alphaproteobacteria bacterium]|nr:hypothetical protein [Alphaproteobacteria bacterium]
MINPPPHPSIVKNGIASAFKFMSKKNNVTSVFNLNSSGFWDSCWTVFLINAVVSTLASYGIKANIDGEIQNGLLPRLLLITIIDICIFSILVNTIFEKIGKSDSFYKFIIPFNWIQSFQAIIMLLFAVLGLIFPPSVFVFVGIGVVIWVTFSLWRVGKEEIGLSGWGATGMIFLSVIIEASLGMLSRSLSMAF